MQSLYTIYFNNGNDVIPLFYTKGYTSAEEDFEDTAKSFVKRFYSEETPYSIRKYEEAVPFTTKVKADASFPSGIIFARKMHDACIYEKVCYPGKVYNGYDVKYIGRIGVLCQQHDPSTQYTEHINSLKSQIDQKDKMLAQQELIISRYEADIARLEKSKMCLEQTIDELKDMDYPRYESAQIPDAPPLPTPVKPLKVSKFAKVGQITGDVLQELTALFKKKDEDGHNDLFEQICAEVEDADFTRHRKEEDDKIFNQLISEIESLNYFTNPLFEK
ncbi:MAG TPA: hypothetical protein PKD85_03360 [Saprospiraceae bacterium]|nr:hypothetical protein [Saprospiraceae bacterium]